MCIGNVTDKEIIRKIAIWKIKLKKCYVKTNLVK